jgi:hypothetical protein
VRYYRQLEIENLSALTQNALAFVRSKPNIFLRKQGINLMRLPLEEFNSKCPEAQAFASTFGLTITDALTFVLWHPSQCGIHRDSWRHKARINIPLLNGRNTYTYFYDNVETIETRNAAGSVVVIAKDQSTPHVDFVETTCPIVLRVQELHNVMLPYSNPVPRITLSLGFDTDPVFLLDDPVNIGTAQQHE